MSQQPDNKKGLYIHLTDPGLMSKDIPLEDPEKFLETLEAQGGKYTHADCVGVRLSAWRPSEKNATWRLGSFASHVRQACQARGFDPEPFDYNIRQLQEFYDYEGMSLEDIAILLEEESKR